MTRRIGPDLRGGVQGPLNRMGKEVGPGAGASGPTDDDRIYGSVLIRIAVAGCKAEGAGAGESFPFLRL
jgi:hypothetical protein